MSGSFQLPKTVTRNPPSLDIDDIPPLIDSIHQGHRTPPYSLGWIISVTEAHELFGPTPPGERPISYYNIDLLPKRWNKVQALPILRSPGAMIWNYPAGRDSPSNEKLHIIIAIARNSRNAGLKIVEEHKEELVNRAVEALGLSPQKQAQLKWYRFH
ncbi:hypothetical protein EV368DRAFT_83521 [Lentinula lateritia]|nr:hypothetical protein EV368DRAFT_83521 [Lentinula lateritia]